MSGISTYRTTSKHPGTMCSSDKNFYREEWQAKLALLNAANRPSRWPADQEWEPVRSYYRCRECGNWHLTRQDPCERAGRRGLT